MPRATFTLPIAVLHERLSYDPLSGELRWKPWLGHSQWNTRYAGKLAGTATTWGYLGVTISHGGKKRVFKAHRVAFAMAHGYWPVGTDHQNRVTSDNRLANLREATHAQNMQNKKMRVNNTSGFTGVTAMKNGRWRAKIAIGGKHLQVGCFAGKEEARRAYLAARQQFHPFAQ